MLDALVRGKVQGGRVLGRKKSSPPNLVCVQTGRLSFSESQKMDGPAQLQAALGKDACDKIRSARVLVVGAGRLDIAY